MGSIHVSAVQNLLDQIYCLLLWWLRKSRSIYVDAENCQELWTLLLDSNSVWFSEGQEVCSYFWKILELMLVSNSTLLGFFTVASLLMWMRQRLVDAKFVALAILVEWTAFIRNLYREGSSI